MSSGSGLVSVISAFVVFTSLPKLGPKNSFLLSYDDRMAWAVEAVVVTTGGHSYKKNHSVKQQLGEERQR